MSSEIGECLTNERNTLYTVVTFFFFTEIPDSFLTSEKESFKKVRNWKPTSFLIAIILNLQRPI